MGGLGKHQASRKGVVIYGKVEKVGGGSSGGGGN